MLNYLSSIFILCTAYMFLMKITESQKINNRKKITEIHIFDLCITI
uniref:Uncharacterized protein n=1 Tax=Meloidogyne enterolobii TaxID=390850 RepID=A0A6V7V7D8_MELEN|nr:unnamed protein product [Meloidogyne enterolobii]